MDKNVHNINQLPLKELVAYAKNARTHSSIQIKQIADSIQEFGFLNPILIDDKNIIIAGHGRLYAAELLGIETVPTVKISHLNKKQIRAYVIADNKLALNAEWDDDLLAMELGDLKGLGFDIDLLGFDEEELMFLLGEVGSVDFPSLEDGDKLEFQQKTFSLHNDQADIVDKALTAAKEDPQCESDLNTNSNGNAITFICQAYLNG